MTSEAAYGASTANRSLDVPSDAAGAATKAVELLRGPGAVVVRGGVDFAPLLGFLGAVDEAYEGIEALVAKHGVWGAGEHLPRGVRFQPTAAALGLDAIPGWETFAHSIVPGLLEIVTAVLGPDRMLDVDICWLRRQYPDSLRPVGQGPHAFHQDGAYGFDFLAAPPLEQSLLPMITAWIPLCPAGIDSPGLELVPAELPRILSLEELALGSIDARWPPASRVRPTTLVGDMVVMAGHHLHRTHVTAGMSRARTCVELRFVEGGRSFAPLSGHRLVSMPA